MAYELIWDFLDNLSESAAAHGQTDGRALHLAIAEAIDSGAPISDYYRRHPWRNDGSFLRSLVTFCQEQCTLLPSYPAIRAAALHEARDAQVLALNHYPDPAIRAAALERWVSQHRPQRQGVDWWELSGAASAPVTIHALLALGAEPTLPPSAILSTLAAYRPWLSAATTMLDSYVDQLEDTTKGDHSYIEHYPDNESALRGIDELVRRSMAEARSLPNGHRHAVIAAAMIAMYLSKDTATAPQLVTGTNTLIRAGGSLTRLLLPILRSWRIIYGQRTA